MIRRSPAASCSGLSTGIAAIVVQLGLAMIPLRASWIASGLTSDTIERDVGVHPEGRRVVDDRDAGGGEPRGELP